MKAAKSLFHTRQPGRVRSAGALFVALALFSNVFPAFAAGAGGGQAASQAKAGRLSDEQRAVHVLNRLSFGPRPGDVERVLRLGVGRYIEEQLNPERIDDRAAEARLANLSTLRMSNGELLAKFPNPGMLIRQLQRRGELPADLAEAVEARRQGNQQQQQQPNAPAAGQPPQINGPESMPAPERDANRNEYRRRIVRYMRENGMEPPARIMLELQASRILRAAYGERQLQEVMVDFWSNHFNVFAGKGADRWFLTSYDRDVIRPNALGNFRDLLEATAKSPAMLFYLDNFQSVSPDAQMNRRRAGLGDLFGMGRTRNTDPERAARRQRRMNRGGDGDDNDTAMARPQQQPQRQRRGLNENYARELMELHTLGVEGGYTQRDVQEVARAFTGWTIIAPRGAAGLEGLQERAGTFVFVPRLHDANEKTVLGQKIAAGGGMEDGQKVLDILVRHPSTAKFIAAKLARRFVSDNPPPALVGRVAAAFTKSEGDIKETLRALFTSPEFDSAEARRAKIKTPFELAVSALRALGAETNGGPALQQWLARMGEGLYQYQAPTGYPDTAEHWVNTGGLLERLNFALALASNRIPGTRVDLARAAGESAAPGRAVDHARVVEQFVSLVLHGEMSDRSRAVLLKQLTEPASAPATSAPTQEAASPADSMTMRGPAGGGGGGGRFGRGQGRAQQADLAATGNPEVARIAALVLGSPEFQRQ